MVRQGKRRRAPAPVVEYISPAPAVIQSPRRQWWSMLHPRQQFFTRQRLWWSILHPRFAVVQAPTPVVEYLAPVPAVCQAPKPVVEFLAPAPAVIVALVEEYISPVPLVHTAPAPVMEFIAPSARTRFDVQVERVMGASVARLGYEWRRTKRREKQLADTLLHFSHELESCPSHGHTVTLLGLLALERSVEFHEQAILELERQVSVVDMLETAVCGDITRQYA